MKVVAEPSAVDTTSWEHVSQNGSAEEVLAYLESATCSASTSRRSPGGCATASSSTRVIALLRQRHVYDDTLWSYGSAHADPATSARVPAARGRLPGALRALRWTRRWSRSIRSSAARTSTSSTRRCSTPRAHRFGRRREILNDGLAAAVPRSCSTILGYRPRLDDDGLDERDLLPAAAGPGRGGAGSLRAGRRRADCRRGCSTTTCARTWTSSPTTTRSRAGIAEPYRDHPVERWRQPLRATC